MTRKLVGALVVAACIGTSPQTAAAQGFTLDHLDIGPVVGLGGIGSASLAFGGRLEKAIRAAPEGLGNGVIGIQVGGTYYSWSTVGYNWSYIPIGVTANYHFSIEGNDQVDPFLGLGLGYQIITCDFTGVGIDICSNSTIYFIGRAGIRYFFQDRMAAYADAGAGGAAVNVGLMFKIGG